MLMVRAWQKFHKVFLNLERTRGVRNRMRKLIVEVKEITQRNIQKLQSIL